ncbi:R13 [Macaca mulatta rhadinovirus 17577]|uniref:VIRF n=2 Tax=Macacine gammaherpesvirus 5 TaxID=154334 RepID=Q77NI1_9GAMA|nr:R13 [Macacine gammaherpesvirus 5]AAD21391.1 R13 [Macaca mulatta rhadinovirus 17577]AAF60043.1 vIRF [Rhesus monkey rhadinovirus H26-95]WUF06357.1 R13 [synthetic construct]WVG99666.1 R13 [Macaca mulatta rhadinovirus]QFN51675.1 ORF R13 [Macacine gammaherpesvirus 5]
MTEIEITHNHLRRWIISNLEANTFPEHLCWCDEEKRSFRISWHRGMSGMQPVVAYCLDRDLECGRQHNVSECRKRLLRVLRENAGFEQDDARATTTRFGGERFFYLRPAVDPLCYACILDSHSETVLNYLEAACVHGLEPGTPLPPPAPAEADGAARSVYARAARLATVAPPHPDQITPFWRLRIRVFYFGSLVAEHTSQDRRGVRLHKRQDPKPGHECFYGTAYKMWLPKPQLDGPLTPEQRETVCEIINGCEEGVFLHGNELGMYVDNRTRHTVRCAGNDAEGNHAQRAVRSSVKSQIFYVMGLLRRLARSPVPGDTVPSNAVTLYLGGRPGSSKRPQVPVTLVICQDELTHGDIRAARWIL